MLYEASRTSSDCSMLSCTLNTIISCIIENIKELPSILCWKRKPPVKVPQWKWKIPQTATKANDSHESCNSWLCEHKCEWWRGVENEEEEIKKNALDVPHNFTYANVSVSERMCVCACVYALNVHLNKLHSMSRTPSSPQINFRTH